MITTCTGCHARYRLDAAKVPMRRIRVRCPECATVYALDGTEREETVVQTTPQVTEAPAPDPLASFGGGSNDLVLEPAAAAATIDETIQETSTTSQSPAAATPAATTDASVAVADVPRRTRRRKRDKSEMLARALVSDILAYNRDTRDKALADGTLLADLGPEIKKSWELYKEKVGAETASGTTYFKDALNEILADGEAIF